MSSWKGIIKSKSADELLESLSRLRANPLKPYQKLELANKFIIPHYIYELIVNIPSATALRSLDESVRKSLKQLLRLAPSTTDCLINARKMDGGLGVIEFEYVCILANIKHILTMQQSKDRLIRDCANSDASIKKLNILKRSLSLDDPLTIHDVESAKIKRKNDVVERWSGMAS